MFSLTPFSSDLRQMALREPETVRGELVPAEQTVPKIPDEPVRQHRLLPRLQRARRFNNPDQSAQQGPETGDSEELGQCPVKVIYFRYFGNENLDYLYDESNSFNNINKENYQ